MEEQAAGEIERIRLLVRRSRGIDLAQYRRSYIGRRLRARMRARGAADASAYARILSRDRDEVSLLLGALSTRVTSFFRDPGLYTCLQTRVFPGILALPRARTLRLWSAGCATGEEAYSLAALAASLPEPPPADRIRIIGTDVDREAIAVAKKGVYPFASLAKVPVDLQRRFFEADPAGGVCRVSQPLRERTVFRVESLPSKPPAGAFDLILCRNVLIYFETALQERVHLQFASALRPGAYLALGRVERVIGPARGAFEMVHARERLYRKI